MADIRIKDLPLATGGTAPSGTDNIAIDGLTTRKTTITDLGGVAVPIASQAESEAGTDPTKRMVPLTVKQSISSEVGVTLASAAQGALADSALQPGEAATPAQGVKADALPSYASGGKGQSVVVKPDGSGFELSGGQTGQFFAEDGARIIRQADRVFVGDAVTNNGTNTGSQPDWLTQYLLSKGRTFAFQQVTQQAVLTTENYLSSNAFLGAAKTSQMTGTGNAIGVLGVAVNNNSTQLTGAYGGYFEGFQQSGALGPSYGVEVDTINFGTASAIDPFQQQNNQTIGVQIAAGAEFPGTSSVSSAINIRNNGANYLRGITFGESSIAGTAGNDGGTGIAIAFATGHKMTYYYAANSASWELYAGVGVNGDYLITSPGSGSVIVPRLKVTIGDPLTAYTPAISATSGTFTSATADGRYEVQGKRVFLWVRVNITSNGTATGGIVVDLPSGLPSATGIGARLSGSEGSVSGVMCQARINGGSTNMQIFRYDNTYAGGTGASIIVSGWYERA